jgi:hypothetical protein
MTRMTTRRWMLAVAAIASMLGVYQMRERSKEFEAESLEHANAAFLYDNSPLHRAALDSRLPPPPNPRKAAYHDAMRRKYVYAAAHPWFPVAPDPPEPE